MQRAASPVILEHCYLPMKNPGYGWDHNAGYGTAEHLAALARLCVTPHHHRRAFAPVCAALSRQASHTDSV
jgi:ribonuclease HII